MELAPGELAHGIHMVGLNEREIHAGVVYAYVAFGDFGDNATIYYFGRTKIACVRELSLDGDPAMVAGRQKYLIKNNCRRSGLNQPSRIILWGKTTDVEKDWDDLKDILKGWRPARAVRPLVTNQLWVGDNWYSCESHGPIEFGAWVRGEWNRMHRNRPDEQVVVGPLVPEQSGDAPAEEEPQPPVDLVVE